MSTETSNRCGRPRGARTRADVINLGAYRAAAQGIKARALAGSATDERMLAILYWMQQPTRTPNEQRDAAVHALLQTDPGTVLAEDGAGSPVWPPNDAA